MAITFVNSNTGSVIDGGELVLSMPASLAEGDVVLIAGLASNGLAFTADPAGWTPIDTSGYLRTLYKVMTATPDTSASFGDISVGTTASGTAIAMAFRGVDTATPLDVAITEVADTFDPAAITPTSNNCCIVILSGGSGLDESIGTIANYSTPVTITSNDTGDSTIGSCYRILSGGGGSEENPAAWSTWGTGGVGEGNNTIALRPFVAGQPYAKRMGGVPFVGNRSGSRAINLWRKMGELFVPPRHIRA